MTEGVFSGKTVVVTGAAKGIGLATARKFARAGARVALVDRDPQALKAALDTLAGPNRPLALQADIAVASEVDRAFNECIETFGGVDVLVNNAAVHFARAIDGYSLDEIDLILG